VRGPETSHALRQSSRNLLDDSMCFGSFLTTISFHIHRGPETSHALCHYGDLLRKVLQELAGRQHVFRQLFDGDFGSAPKRVEHLAKRAPADPAIWFGGFPPLFFSKDSKKRTINRRRRQRRGAIYKERESERERERRRRRRRRAKKEKVNG
jgi:hypothetical protein